jgi:glutamate-1-semialdehyde 2,1-aminomutase/spore coat polysaccharide biosynthesis protein SpsF
MKTVLIGIARMGSTRLPGKVLKKLGGHAYPYNSLHRIMHIGYRAPKVDQVVIATSTLPQDDAIHDFVVNDIGLSGIGVFRGSETDVLSRVYEAAVAFKADVIVRVTCDCPFLDPQVIGEVIALRAATGAAYCSNNDPPVWPDGLDCEAFTMEALTAAHYEAKRPTDRDTVTQFIVRNRRRFPAVSLPCPLPGMNRERWVLDTVNDLAFCERIADEFCDQHMPPSYLQILEFLNKNPHLRDINSHHPRNERFFEALINEEPVTRPHDVSKALLAKTREIIPLAAQTFSKSYLQYPQEAPLFVTHGNGGVVYDVDGNDYVDLVGGLLPNILGYRDPDVDFAVRQQLGAGISFSVATELEAELALKLRQIIPCAEMSRFGKNGTDVTQAAIRLARHYTKRQNILTSGYHGWSDWSICHDPMRHNGVLDDVQKHTTILTHGDINAVKVALYTGSFACVIVEPETDPVFLGELRRVCDLTKTILIFDEIITGFRFGLGGAQSLYNVIPDLATFGKSMGNGMPISVLCGKTMYMKEMENICFSGTFFGETLSLAASLATIKKLEQEPVNKRLYLYNKEMQRTIQEIAHKYKVYSINAFGDHLLRLNFSDQDIKTLFIQEMIANGILIITSFNFCWAHEDHHITRIHRALDRTFATISKAIREDKVSESIKGKVIEASANVRQNKYQAG